MTHQIPRHAQHDFIPGQLTAAEIEPTELFQAAFKDAIERTPIELQKFVGERTTDNPRLFERVIIECAGSQELASLLLRYDQLASQLDDPAYDHDVIKAEMDDVSKRAVDFRGTPTETS